MQQPDLRIIISGGGTGGHIFPAIAIADTLKKRIPDTKILFIGAKNKMEMLRVPEAGYKIEGLWISGLQRNFSLRNLLFPIKLILSLIKANKIIKKFKPSVVIGFGGYASGPALKAANWQNIPSLIQEQNSYPGITNRILAKKVNTICVAYTDMEKYFPKHKIVITGNPIRQDIIDIIGKKEKAYKYFELENHKNTLLIVGGSQGSLAINKSIINHIDEFKGAQIQVIWQTGKLFFETAKKACKTMQYERIRIFEFIDRMDYAYAIADMIVSRAGALAISEICAVKKPSILIPFPSAAEDHQTKNAMALVKKNAAVLIKNSDANQEVGKTILSLFSDENKRKILSENIEKLSITDSADRITDEIIKLIKQN
ncbi:undecaprenyldiphospho-muramoylpentapeptide beta-N-acetylglucosaminyltransferase [Bacteroidota bacterium]